MPVEGYVSNYPTHFVGKRQPPEEQFELLKKILSRRWLTHPPHIEQPTLNFEVRRSAKFSDNEMLLPAMICFCDIPEEHLRIHTTKYSQFGVAFSRAYLVGRGANPVFYVARNSTVSRKKREHRKDRVPKSTVTPEEYATLRNQPAELAKFKDEPRGALLDEYMKEMFDLWYEKERFETGGPDQGIAEILSRDKLMWTFFLQHVFGFVKCFDDTLELDHEDNYYMEREWRRFGNLNFTPDDVAIVYVPPNMVERARAELPEYSAKVRPLPEWS